MKEENELRCEEDEKCGLTFYVELSMLKCTLLLFYSEFLNYKRCDKKDNLNLRKWQKLHANIMSCVLEFS